MEGVRGTWGSEKHWWVRKGGLGWEGENIRGIKPTLQIAEHVGLVTPPHAHTLTHTHIHTHAHAHPPSRTRMPFQPPHALITTRASGI